MSASVVSLIEEIGRYSILNRQVPLRAISLVYPLNSNGGYCVRGIRVPVPGLQLLTTTLQPITITLLYVFLSWLPFSRLIIYIVSCYIN